MRCPSPPLFSPTIGLTFGNTAQASQHQQAHPRPWRKSTFHISSSPLAARSQPHVKVIQFDRQISLVTHMLPTVLTIYITFRSLGTLVHPSGSGGSNVLPYSPYATAQRLIAHEYTRTYHCLCGSAVSQPQLLIIITYERHASSRAHTGGVQLHTTFWSLILCKTKMCLGDVKNASHRSTQKHAYDGRGEQSAVMIDKPPYKLLIRQQREVEMEEIRGHEVQILTM